MTHPETRAAVTGEAIAASLLLDVHCELGECPLWCDREHALWWTDIESARLWRHRPGDDSLRHWSLPDRVGSFALCESGRLLLGLAKGLAFAEVSDDDVSITQLQPVDANLASVRINDGRTDRGGNFVFGTLNEAPARERIGSIYQYSLQHGLRRLDLGGVAIPNSLCFSPDGDWLYYCDSTDGRILRCRYRADEAWVGPPEVFVAAEDGAAPDGATVDRAGRVWSAKWGGGRVVCHDTDGSIRHVVEVPASNVTCPVFAGAGLDRLLVTSARVELSAAQLQAESQAGAVFEAPRLDAVGLPEVRFKDR